MERKKTASTLSPCHTLKNKIKKGLISASQRKGVKRKEWEGRRGGRGDKQTRTPAAALRVHLLVGRTVYRGRGKGKMY